MPSQIKKWKAWLKTYKECPSVKAAKSDEVTQYLFRWWMDKFHRSEAAGNEEEVLRCMYELRQLAILMNRIEKGEKVDQKDIFPENEDMGF